MDRDDAADDNEQIQRARNKVQNQLDKDELSSAKLDHYVYRKPTLIRRRYIDIPQSILDNYDHLSCKCFLGILPEINRVYITVDNRLFLWNYCDGSYYVFDELGQIIVSVGLVKPKPGIFVDDIVYLLVVATPTEIVLLGVRFDGDSFFGDIELVPTSYFVSSDNVHMLKIVGTPAPSSRIFMCGKDGCVYEVDYSNGSRWFSKKCQKVNRGSIGRRIFHILPFPFLQSSDPIVDMVVSSSTGRLYALTQSSSVLSYDLGTDFESCIGPLTLSLTPQSVPSISEPFRIVALSVPDCQTTSSTSACDVVAITEHAHRIFLRHDNSDLVIDSVRVCPRYVSVPYTDGERERFKPFYSKGQSPEMIRYALYCDGTFLGADLRDPDADTLLCFTSTPAPSRPAIRLDDPGSPSKDMNSFVDENVEAHLLEARAHDIREQPIDFYLTSEVARSLYKQDSDSPVVGLSVFATQHALPQREFLVLSSSRLSVFAQGRPVDELREILTAGSSVSQLKEFFDKYGQQEACAMCVILICSSSTRLLCNPDASNVFQVDERRYEDTSVTESDFSNPNGFSMDQRVKQAAVDAFQTYGGTPSLQRHHPDSISFSGRHDGLYSYLSRVLRSVWLWSIVVESTSTPGLLSLRYATHTWKILLAPLLQLDRFLQDYPQEFSRPRGATNSVEPAFTLERSSLSNLRVFLTRCIEVLRLIVIISETDNIAKVVDTMEQSDVYTLGSHTFRDFVSTESGTRALRSLIRSFMDQHAHGDRVMIQNLQRSCPSFIDTTDLYLFQGNEYVHLAKSSIDNNARRKHCEREAVECYKRASGIIQFPLQPSLDKLQELGLYCGMVELCLHRSQVLFSLEAELAQTDSRPKRNVGEDLKQRRQTLVARRHTCYLAIVHRLEELDAHGREQDDDAGGSDVWMEPTEREQALRAALEVCLSSKDAEFLTQFFFPWYIERSRTLPYELPCDALEQYLCANHQNHDRLKLYYSRLRMFGKASSYFHGLAMDDPASDRFSLQDRIQFLETAIECTKHFGPTDDSRHDL